MCDVQAADAMRNADSISVKTALKMLHPEWTRRRVRKEMRRMRLEWASGS